MKNCKPGPAHRFKETLEQFFESVNLQAQDRDANQIPDLESFIDIRRDTSGCKSTFDLIEYAYDLDVPQEVLEHPVIEALKQGSNDLVAWSNVSFLPCDTPFLYMLNPLFPGHLLLQRRTGSW